MKRFPAALSLALFALPLHAQTAPAKLPAFDVASVKANKSNDPPFANMPLGPGAAAPNPDDSGPTFAEALRRQPGIKLESTKTPLDVLVLDHVEHLIEN